MYPCKFISLNYEQLRSVIQLCTECGLFCKGKNKPVKKACLEALGGIVVTVVGFAPELSVLRRFSGWINKNKWRKVVPRHGGVYNKAECDLFRQQYLDYLLQMHSMWRKLKPLLKEYEVFEQRARKRDAMDLFFDMCRYQRKINHIIISPSSRNISFAAPPEQDIIHYERFEMIKAEEWDANANIGEPCEDPLM